MFTQHLIRTAILHTCNMDRSAKEYVILMALCLFSTLVAFCFLFFTLLFKQKRHAAILVERRRRTEEGLFVGLRECLPVLPVPPPKTRRVWMKVDPKAGWNDVLNSTMCLLSIQGIMLDSFKTKPCSADQFCELCLYVILSIE